MLIARGTLRHPLNVVAGRQLDGFVQPVPAANGGNRGFDPPRPWCASTAEKQPVSLTARNRRLSIRDGSGAEMAPIEAAAAESRGRPAPLGLARCRLFCSDRACDGMVGVRFTADLASVLSKGVGGSKHLRSTNHTNPEGVGGLSRAPQPH